MELNNELKNLLENSLKYTHTYKHTKANDPQNYTPLSQTTAQLHSSHTLVK